MFTHEDLARLQGQSLKMQGWIRQQTYSPDMEKTLRRFSSWELAELILRVNQSTLRGRMATDPSLPQGLVEEDGRQRWYTLEEINEIRRRLKINRKSLLPPSPARQAGDPCGNCQFQRGGRQIDRCASLCTCRCLGWIPCIGRRF